MLSSRARSPIRSIRLTIVTALSLRKPRGRSDLERRLVDRSRTVFGGYPELDYVRLIDAGPAAGQYRGPGILSRARRVARTARRCSSIISARTTRTSHATS